MSKITVVYYCGMLKTTKTQVFLGEHVYSSWHPYSGTKILSVTREEVVS